MLWAGFTPRAESQLHRDPLLVSIAQALARDTQVCSAGGLVSVFCKHPGDPSVQPDPTGEARTGPSPSAVGVT